MPTSRNRTGGLHRGTLFDTNIKATSIDRDIFTDQTVLSSIAGDDLILLLDVSETPDVIKYMTRTNFVSGLTSSTITVTDNEDTDEANLITFVAGAATSTGTHGLEMDGNLNYNPSTGTLSAPNFSGTATTATVATTVTITDNESTSETNAVIFTAGGDVDGGNLGLESDGDFTYNPSSGTVAATTFSGALSGNATTATALATGRTIAMTGDVAWTSASFDGSGNVTGAGTIQANAVEGSMLNNNTISGQTEITSGLAAADELLYDDGGVIKKIGLDNFVELTPALATEDAVADGDYILFLDGGASGSMNKEAVHDLATLFAGTGLTASSSVIGVDASQTQITAVGTIATGVWEATDVAVAHGGTGASSLTDNAVLTGTGTSAITAESTLSFTGDTLTATSTSANLPMIELTNTHAGATAGKIRFNKDSGSGDDNDVMGTIEWYGTDAAENTHERLAYIDSYIIDSAAGSEAAGLRFYVAENDATNTLGLQILGQADDNAEVDVILGAGTASTTTIAGTLTMGSTAAMTNGGLLSVANQSNITGVGTVSSGTWEATDVGVAHGGTGASTLTDGGVLLGSGTGAITAMSVLADSEMIVGDGSGDPVAESGATLRTSIGVGTGDSPQFTSIELGHASNTTLARSGAGDLTIEGNAIYRAGGTDVAIADGGTGAGTATAGFDALSPMSAEGDIIYGGSSGTVTRLGKGSDDEVLTLASGVPTWAAATAGTPTYTSSSANQPVISITNTHADATGGYLKFVKDPGSGQGADNDILGTITFHGTDASNNAPEELARMEAYIIEADDTDETSGLKLYVAENSGDLAVGLSLLGQAEDGEVDVNIGAGTSSVTTIAGTLTMGSTAAMTNAGLVSVANQSGITGLGTVSSGTWEATDVGVAHGGTGASTLTDGGVLLGSGTGAITAMAVLSDGEMIVGDGTGDPVAESGSTLRTSIGLGSVATRDTGISNNNIPIYTSGVADNDFLRIDGTAVEGRSASEVLSDIGAGAAAGSSSIVTTGALDSGSITSGFGNVDTGSSTITTTGAVATGTVTAGGIIKTDDTTDATSTTDGSLQTDGGLSVAKDGIFGDDVTLITDSAVLNLGIGSDVKLTHDGTTGGTLSGTPIVVESLGASALANDTHTGIVLNFIAHENLVVGNAVYVHTDDGEVAKARANAVGTMPAIGIVVADADADDPVKVLTHGIINDSNGWGGELTEGATMYVDDDTAGLVHGTIPDADGEFVQVMGIAVGPRDIFVNPSLDIIERD